MLFLPQRRKDAKLVVLLLYYFSQRRKDAKLVVFTLMLFLAKAQRR